MTRPNASRLYDYQGREIIPPKCKKCKRNKNILAWNGKERLYFCDRCEFMPAAARAVVFDYTKKYLRKNKNKPQMCGWSMSFDKPWRDF